MLVLIHDDLEVDAQGYLDTVCDFIGIDHIALASSSIGERRINTFSAPPRNQRLARERASAGLAQGARSLRRYKLLAVQDFGVIASRAVRNSRRSVPRLKRACAIAFAPKWKRSKN